MDAPIYPPAVAFEQLIVVPYEFRLENHSLAELMAVPAAWNIVLKHLPALKSMASNPGMKPHLDNFTVPTVPFYSKAVTPEIITRINQELSQLRSPQGSQP